MRDSAPTGACLKSPRPKVVNPPPLPFPFSRLCGFFRVHITDLLSGYRAFNARVVKSLPFQSRGFESETELTVKCLVRGYRIVEIPIDLLARPAGSFSKIRLVQDGLLIVHTMVALARDYRPLTAFGLVGLALIGCGLLPGAIVIRDYLRTGLVERMPSAVLAVGLILAGLLIGLVGLVLHAVARHFQELDWQIANLAEDELKWHQPTQTP